MNDLCPYGHRFRPQERRRTECAERTASSLYGVGTCLRHAATATSVEPRICSPQPKLQPQSSLRPRGACLHACVRRYGTKGMRWSLSRTHIARTCAALRATRAFRTRARHAMTTGATRERPRHRCRSGRPQQAPQQAQPCTRGAQVSACVRRTNIGTGSGIDGASRGAHHRQNRSEDRPRVHDVGATYRDPKLQRGGQAALMGVSEQNASAFRRS